MGVGALLRQATRRRSTKNLRKIAPRRRVGCDVRDPEAIGSFVSPLLVFSHTFYV